MKAGRDREIPQQFFRTDYLMETIPCLSSKKRIVFFYSSWVSANELHLDLAVGSVILHTPLLGTLTPGRHTWGQMETGVWNEGGRGKKR